MSGRQRVDIWGAVPNEKSWSLFFYLSVWGLYARALTRPHQYHSLFMHRPKDGSTWNGTYYCQVPPPVYLSSVYLTWLHVTKSPKPSSSVFVFCKRSNSGGGNSLRMRLESGHSQRKYFAVLDYSPYCIAEKELVGVVKLVIWQSRKKKKNNIKPYAAGWPLKWLCIVPVP